MPCQILSPLNQSSLAVVPLCQAVPGQGSVPGSSCMADARGTAARGCLNPPGPGSRRCRSLRAERATGVSTSSQGRAKRSGFRVARKRRDRPWQNGARCSPCDAGELARSFAMPKRCRSERERCDPRARARPRSPCNRLVRGRASSGEPRRRGVRPDRAPSGVTAPVVARRESRCPSLSSRR